MKILLDENLPHALRPLFAGHDVYTVAYLGWAGISNGKLLRLAEQNAFEAFVTLDNGVPYQQNLADLAFHIVVLSAPSNDIDDLGPLVPQILDYLASDGRPHTVKRIGDR